MQNSDLTFNDACDVLSELLATANLSFGHGAPDADSEAFWILSHCVHIAPIDALDRVDEPYPTLAFDRANAIVHERISTRKPLAYLLGEAWLMGYDFICDERSIVPRSFIAELISDEILEPWLPPGGRALDLCTGNGSLAILLSIACPDMIVCATDISPDALELAALNIEKYQLDESIELFCGDLFEGLPPLSANDRFDIILCNPPYVNSSSMAQLPDEYLQEPSIALAGGTDGMVIIRKIIKQAKDYLNHSGALVLEIGNEYEHFKKAFPEMNVTWLSVSSGTQQVLLITYKDLP
ncbi:50S ribosomal protein L3 glutamine methyltransferase [Polynucleobacter sp. SHI8]|uniref:50S ribosomal protein L3 N(5)-glutamine methyltransferase n=1 Tax=unclassified Polynucleobacter TaxID=2640945 RepID=UPI002491B619|nr:MULTISPECIES: 50S ribosomal protein L3 N(5)-glutamine methyltransferase [unclassified Polynucleobacter]BDW11180.1 50S ribosomal protein L3 glutamine methyltransferase [Polynucleobacter sp. SHI2]BDW13626.1 50S ribosomal protein L3 glutamine methyltransferase [Polynucleobacter sp. SHI8]